MSAEEIDFDALIDAAIDEMVEEEAAASRADALVGMLELMDDLGIDGIPVPLPMLEGAEELAPGLYGSGPVPADLSLESFRKAVSAGGDEFFVLGLVGAGLNDNRLVYRIRDGSRAIAGDIPVLNADFARLEPSGAEAVQAFVADVTAVLSAPDAGDADTGVAMATRSDDGEEVVGYVGPGDSFLAFAGASDTTAPFGGLFEAAIPSANSILRAATDPDMFRV